MKAIILAAGKGVRLRPYTHLTPKPLLKINGKRIIDYTLSILPEEIDEIIIVVGHRKWRIKQHLGSSYKGKKITYISQGDKRGTAHALYLCKPYLRKKERFLVVFGDDIYVGADLKRCIQYPLSILAAEVENPSAFGVLRFNKDHHLEEIVEKPKDNPPSNLVVCGVFVLSHKIFKYKMQAIDNKEFGLPQTIMKIAKNHPIKIVKASFWLPIGYPKDLKKAKEIMFAKNNDIS
jgi:glucose-1-phosphate thymidylyltransferase